MESKKRTTVIVVIFVVLAILLAVFFIRDDKKKVIERKTGYSVPDNYTIEKYVGYGSIFNRTGFEARIVMDSTEHMNETIAQLNGLLGDDYHEISLDEYAIQKYSLFANQKLVPSPTSVSWVIVGNAGAGKLVAFVCIENQTQNVMYLYYAE